MEREVLLPPLLLRTVLAILEARPRARWNVRPALVREEHGRGVRGGESAAPTGHRTGICRCSGAQLFGRLEACETVAVPRCPGKPAGPLVLGNLSPRSGRALGPCSTAA